MFQRFHHTAVLATLLAGAALPALAQEEEGDGAPHIAIAQDGTELEIEFEVETGLDESGPIPTLTLDASFFSLGNYQTRPLNDTPSPNDDLGFVSEVEGAGEEGGTIDADIVIRLVSASDNFLAFDGVTQLFDAVGAELALGSAFDLHPTWALTNAIDDFTPATATFDIVNVAGGEATLGQFSLVLTVPEPASAALLALVAPLALRRRRSA